MKKPPENPHLRLIKSVYDMATNDPTGDDVAFISAPLCHVFFPHSNPGNEVDFWKQSHGNFKLSIEATRVLNPETDEPERVGLPYGPKPRLILSLLNTVMLKQKSPEVTLGNSLTNFIGDHLGLTTDGRTINEVKNQLARLSTSLISATYTIEKNHSQHDSLKLIRGIDIWWNKDANQRHLWGNYLRFSDDYFNDVMAHGVPVDKRALNYLSGNALGLDIYAFLAHRLHHIRPEKPVQISWKAIKDQFGQSYSRMDNFKAVFRRTLKLVQAVYQEAKLEEITNKGFILYNSKPPIAPRTTFVLPHIPETEPETTKRPIEPFSDLFMKRDPTEMSARKFDEIKRAGTDKWDGKKNARYKDVKKKPPTNE
ncbi:replication protein RepA [Spirosoma pomorum]